MAAPSFAFSASRKARARSHSEEGEGAGVGGPVSRDAGSGPPVWDGAGVRQPWSQTRETTTQATVTMEWFGGLTMLTWHEDSGFSKSKCGPEVDAHREWERERE